MRTRHLLAGAATALLAVLVLAGPASAQEGEGEEPELTHDAEECLEILEDGGDVDDCQEAPSPILPPANELFWGAVSFAALLGLLWKFAWPGIKAGMEDRTERIRKSLGDADQAKTEATSVLEDYQRQLADAKAESGRIIEEARQSADALREERKTALDAEMAELRQRAAADIEAAKSQVMADLRGEVAALAIGAAETVVQRSLDQDTNVALIENYINQVGAQSQ
ncbi:hypothetical protein BH20ACT2_BH20ACT2_09850 [soil metagenome]